MTPLMHAGKTENDEERARKMVTSARRMRCALAGLLIGGAMSVHAGPVFMSAEWGKVACDGWNADPVLTDELGKSGWIENDGGRGFKVMQVYRLDCPDSPRVELRIANQDGKAMCVYGGAVETAELDKKMDYIMYAKDEHWVRMGEGKDGAMKAMMFGRLKFTGPKGEAMGNMGPFGNFLLLTGKIDADRSTCPK
jgi:putative sterol carrier protein